MVLPAEASLLTWEWTTTFDKVPAEQELRASFAEDFPETTRRLNESGGNFHLWLLTSFNSPEGRRFRYLVALDSCRPSRAQQRLPEQIYLYGAADLILRKAEADGNALLYHLSETVLTVLIFFEGRLCFWAEESGYENAGLVEERLECYRQFLKVDDLFSRQEKYEFLNLQEAESFLPRTASKTARPRTAFFRRAVKDPFWRKKNLNRCERDQEKDGRKLRTLALVFLLFVLVYSLWPQTKNATLPDVEPPELSLPQIEKTEFAEPAVVPNKFVESAVTPKSVCPHPLPQINGVVLNRLFLSGGKTYSVGDSLGPFLVVEILRGGVLFLCDGIQVVGEVK